jgi:uncharacterized protein YbbK (DUF523 family)
MQKILVSACLLGEKVRYDGNHKQLNHEIFRTWEKEGRLIPLCPEMAGGLPAPRAPAEINGDKVLTVDGTDVSAAFQAGAKAALVLCHTHHIQMAILKARSPSCGNQQIYDGSFSTKIISGQGITASLLMKNGIKVFNEEQLHMAVDYLSALLRHDL